MAWIVSLIVGVIGAVIGVNLITPAQSAVDNIPTTVSAGTSSLASLVPLVITAVIILGLMAGAAVSVARGR